MEFQTPYIRIIGLPELPPPPMVDYAQYTELLSRLINGLAASYQREQIGNFEAAQSEICPHCQARVRSQFEPKHRIVHDVPDCGQARSASGVVFF